MVEVGWHSKWSFCPVGFSCFCGLWSCLVSFGLKSLKSGSVRALFLPPSMTPHFSGSDTRFRESCLSCSLAFTSSVYVTGSIPIREGEVLRVSFGVEYTAQWKIILPASKGISRVGLSSTGLLASSSRSVRSCSENPFPVSSSSSDLPSSRRLSSVASTCVHVGG